MPRRVALPPQLRVGAFTTRDATAAGIGEGRLRGRDLDHPFHGLHATTTPTDLLERCRAFTPLLRPGDFFSHTTAAELWGCPLPDRDDASKPLHVSSLAPSIPVRRDGIVGHRAASARVELRHGLPVSEAPATWLALGATLPPSELVVTADHLVLEPAVLDPRDIRPYTSTGALAAELAGFRGRGARALAGSLPLVRQGAESRRETLLRLLLADAGLPEPELQVELYEKRRFLGRVDLYYREYRVAVEYDGDAHRSDVRQYDRDITRIDDLIAFGISVVRVRSRGLSRTPADTVARVTRALVARGWSPRARQSTHR